ncbi:MAG TPA: hypothetical protein VKB57_11845 [Acidimicrobiales bacterium]|nr:hypothetical protein [Acidimicrobiales bacterium]
MSTPPPVEDRLRSSLAAEASAADRVAAGDDSLGAIRTRARAGRRRRAAGLAAGVVAVVVAGAVALPRLDRGPGARTDDGPVATEGPSTTSPSSPSPTSVPDTVLLPASVVPAWPQPGGPTFTTPETAARAFVRIAVLATDPPLSGLHSDGTIDVLGADGSPVSRLDMRRDATGHWSVVRATSDRVWIESPTPAGAATDPISSPLHVTGRTRSSVVGVAVLSAGAVPHPVGATGVHLGGGGDELPSYSANVPLSGSPGGRGLLVVHTEATDANGLGVPPFAAQGVVLPPAAPRLPGVLLWPYASIAEADAAADAGEAWHGDPGETALRFARDYLGFSEMNTVTSRDVRNNEAWIGVGPDNHAAAVLHLAKLKVTDGLVWAVVGSSDDLLTLETPRYGATVDRTFAVGGHITGVDESLRVSLHRLGTSGPVGEACCLPGGGEKTPWSTTVSADPGTGPGVVTVVVSTGGHVYDVERFAITALRLR